MQFRIEELNAKLNAIIPQAENARSFALWINAPTPLVDAVQTALDGLNEAAEIAKNEIERRKDNAMLKELKTMLDAYKAVKADVKATTERIGKVAEVCAKCNAGLDEIFADFADEEAVEADGAADAGTVEEAATDGEQNGTAEATAEQPQMESIQ